MFCLFVCLYVFARDAHSFPQIVLWLLSQGIFGSVSCDFVCSVCPVCLTVLKLTLEASGSRGLSPTRTLGCPLVIFFPHFLDHFPLIFITLP